MTEHETGGHTHGGDLYRTEPIMPRASFVIPEDAEVEYAPRPTLLDQVRTAERAACDAMIAILDQGQSMPVEIVAEVQRMIDESRSTASVFAAAQYVMRFQRDRLYPA